MTVGELKKVLDEATDDLEIFYISDGLVIPLLQAAINERNMKRDGGKRVKREPC